MQVPTPPEVFEEALSSVTKENDDWITDGMYISRREAFWHRATDIICEYLSPLLECHNNLISHSKGWIIHFTSLSGGASSGR